MEISTSYDAENQSMINLIHARLQSLIHSASEPSITDESSGDPPITGDGDSKDSLTFQCIDIQAYDRPLVTSKEPYSERSRVSPEWGIRVASSTERYCEKRAGVTLFGRTMTGQSVAVHLHFRPYFYIKVPTSWIDYQIRHTVESMGTDLGMEITWEECTLRHMLWGFTPDPEHRDAPQSHRVVKVVFTSMADMKKARSSPLLQGDGVVVCEVDEEEPTDPEAESRIIRKFNMIQQFLDSTRVIHSEEHAVKPCGWVSASHFKDVEVLGEGRATHCDLEVRCTELEHIRGEPIHATSPYLIACMDIECFGSNGFPKPTTEADKVICIGTTLQVFGQPDHMVRVVQCLGRVAGSHDPRDQNPQDPDSSKNTKNNDGDLITLSYPTELALLEGWRDLIVVYTDADIITGYNLHGFDYNYIVTRHHRLTGGSSDSRFMHLGRVINQRTFCRVGKEEEEDEGGQKKLFLRTSGRVTVDMFQWINRQQSRFKLESYSLNNVAATYLGGMRKVDLEAKRLFELFREGTPGGMREIAEYCSRDCDLPLMLMSKLQTLTELGELCKITSTLLHDIMSRGQQVQVFNQIMMNAHAMGYVVNPIPPEVLSALDDTKYEGATVIQPKSGFYDVPISTLDFNSLYPSIMQTHNLCFSTYVIPGSVERDALGKHTVHTTTDGREHVFMEGQEGVLPCILRTLLAARKAVKKQMKTTKDQQTYALLDGRQLAIKISANSVYGFTGVGGERGYYPNLAIAETTTLEGRKLIHETKRIVEQEDGYEVIYGDTDSVMVNFGIRATPDLSDEQRLRMAFRLGEALADKITDRFPAQVVIEMEKIYFPMLMVTKKRYAGLKYTRVEAPDEVDVKGMEIVRRDNSAFARRVMSEVLNVIMHTRDVAKAKEVLAGHLAAVRDNTVPFEDFVMSKALRDHYKNTNLPHLTVVDKIAQRKGEVPRCGDRVPFVIVRTKDKEAKFFEKAEDPTYARAHAVPIDRSYYVKKQVMVPIGTLFRPFDPHPDRLFESTLASLDREASGMRRLTDCLGVTGGGAKAQLKRGVDCLEAVTEAAMEASSSGRGGDGAGSVVDFWSSCTRAVHQTKRTKTSKRRASKQEPCR